MDAQQALNNPQALSKTILLVEDNPVNCKVAQHYIAKLGHAIEIVGNGREALTALAAAPYDLVLMDCQMPVMDGYEATVALRCREKNGVAPKRTPVIAITAHALVGDHARCLAAGMDDYITKPIIFDELRRVIELWLASPTPIPDTAHPNGAASHPMIEEATNTNSAPPVDMVRLRDAMGDDAEEVREILELCITQLTKNIAELRHAIEREDANALDLVGHNCAGVSANCGFAAMIEPFRELECRGREGRLAGAADIVTTIEKEFARTQIFLHKHVGEF